MSVNTVTWITLGDMAVGAISGALLWMLFHHRARLRYCDLMAGAAAAVIGLVAIDLLYFSGMLQLGYSRLIIIAAVVSIAAGFAHVCRQLFYLVDHMEELETSLPCERSLRKQKEAELKKREEESALMNRTLGANDTVPSNDRLLRVVRKISEDIRSS